jgi:hypothetical protein
MNLGIPLSNTTKWQGRWLATLLPLTISGLLILFVHYAAASFSTHSLAPTAPTADSVGGGGELSEDTILYPDDNPHIIDRELIVPAGVTLTVKPGVEMRFAPGVALIVRGRLLAEGTPTQTILLTRRDDGTYWSHIVIDDSLAETRIAYAVIEYMRGIQSERSRFLLQHSEIHDTNWDAIRTVGGKVVIQGNHIYNVACEGVPGCEGIQVNQTLPDAPTLVLDNHVHHVDDDCLDINDASVFIERNHVHHCDDKGISIGTIGEVIPGSTQPSSATIVNNLVYASSIGIAVKDSAFARIVHNTIVDNIDGLALYEAAEHPGYGGGQATVVNTILWGNRRSIRLNLNSTPPSTVTVTYSDVEGEWPGTENLAADPSFRAVDDYHLSSDSPVIDAGHDGTVAVDLDGLPRPVGGAPDMGAYELQALLYLSAWPGNQRAHLAWQLLSDHPALFSFAISCTVSPHGSTAFPPFLITGLPTTTRAYTLTGLTNYLWYTVVVEAQDERGDLLARSPPAVVMPTDRYIYLPLTLVSLTYPAGSTGSRTTLRHYPSQAPASRRAPR